MEKTFPKELLDKPPEERKGYFENLRVSHPNLEKCYNDLKQAINNANPQSIIFLFGPTGVGKTTILEKLLNDYAANYSREDPGQIPIIYTEAVAPGSGNFHWGDLYNRYLMALEEPCISKKVSYQTLNRTDRGILIKPKATERDLRLAVEKSLHFRKVNVCLIDEAQHLGKIGSGKKYVDQLDAIKSLANISQTTHVLAGTYELDSFFNLSGQLSRRTIQVHFKRYTLDENDVRTFKSVLRQLQFHLPVKDMPDLLSNAEDFYVRSMGCVGILKSWLSLSLAAAIDDDSDTVGQKYIDKFALTPPQLEKMIEETVESERKVAEGAKKLARVRDLLSIKPHTEKPKNATEVKNNKGKKNKPFTSKPARHPVGRGNK